MPQIITQNYELSGWGSVVIYSESEMAQALGLSRKDLRKAIEGGKLSYHAHPSSNALKEYQFNVGAYEYNLKVWDCIKSGGHHFQFEKYYTLPEERVQKAKYKCRNCPAKKYD